MMPTRRQFLTGAAAVVGTSAIGLGIRDASVEAADDPTDVDLGFCADMTAHHVQALAMCQRVLSQDTGDPVQAAAAEVLQNQAIEVGMMRAWLTDWGASTVTPELAMGWMGMNGDAGVPVAMMPGMATEAEMASLSYAEGRDQGRMWLELMTAHHVGGVAMAEAAVELASAPKVVRLAETQVAVQTFEITMYEQLLATTYA